MKLNLLLVDDDLLALRLLKQAAGSGHILKTASTIDEAKKLLEDQTFDLAFIDLNISTALDGLTLIGPLKKGGATVVVTSSHEEDYIIARCYEKGCDSYYAKGELTSSAGLIVQDVLRKRLDPLTSSVFEHEYVTQDEDMRNSARALLRAVTLGLNGLVLGPTGSGKSELARVIHRHSGIGGNLVEVNCAGLPHDLIEAELFGHERGSFTGADKNRIGKVKLADKGILFLDEIGSLPLEAQPKLLKILEEKCFYPVGSDTPVKSDFRLIAATNEDLFALAAKGLFRLDLLQRLCGTVVHLKALEKRPADIFPLIKTFNITPKRLHFKDKAQELILHHPWSGNIREVKQFVDHCLAQSTGSIDEEVVRSFFSRQGLGQENEVWSEESWRKALAHGLDAACDDFRVWVINKTLSHNKGNVTKTMKDLAISSRQYYNHLPKHKKDFLPTKITEEIHVIH